MIAGLIGGPASATVSAMKGNPPGQVVKDAGRGSATSMANAACGAKCATAASVAIDTASGSSAKDTIVNGVATGLGAAAGNAAQKIGITPSLGAIAKPLVTKPISTGVSEGVKAIPGGCNSSSGGCPH